jgi:hypothetical protein
VAGPVQAPYGQEGEHDDEQRAEADAEPGTQLGPF